MAKANTKFKAAGMLLACLLGAVTPRAQDITVHVMEENSGKPVRGITLNLRRRTFHMDRPDSEQKTTDRSGTAVFNAEQLSSIPFSIDLFSIPYSQTNLDFIFMTPESALERKALHWTNPVITALPANITFQVKKRTLLERLDLLFRGD